MVYINDTKNRIIRRQLMSYKIGFMGCGGRGHAHSHAYKKIEDVELTAAADINTKRLQRFQEEFKIQNGYKTFKEMLENEELDIVHLATQPTLRVEPIIMAAEYGAKVILSEKPLALNLPDYDTVLAACEKSDATLVINHQLRYQTNWQKLREAVESDRLGPIRIIRISDFLSLISDGTHILDLVIFMLPNIPPTSVTGVVWDLSGYSETHAGPNKSIGVIDFGKECRCYFEIGQNAPAVPNVPPSPMAFQMQIWGDDGRAETSLSQGYRIWGKGEKEWIGEVIPYKTQDIISQAKMTKDLIRCIEDKDFIHPCDARIGRISFEIIEGVCHSSLRSEPVDLPLKETESALVILREKAKEEGTSATRS